MKKISLSFITFLSLLGSASLVRADDSIGRLGFAYWNYGISGHATVEGSGTDIDDTSKIISGTNHGFLLTGDRRFDTWGLLLDLYMGKQSASRQLSSSESVDWSLESSMLTFGGFYSFIDEELEDGDKSFGLDGVFGIRGYMNYYDLDFNPYNAANDKSREDQVGWVDPILGFRLKAGLTPNLGVRLYGDAGGFGIGSASELSVLTNADLVWSITEGFNLTGGYRLFDVRSPDKTGDRKTEIDLQMRGLTIGFEGTF